MNTPNLKTKIWLQILVTIFLTIQISISQAQSQIDACFVNFKPYAGISIGGTNHLPGNKVTYRQLPTANGVVKISQQNGTRVIYNNNKNAPFINLKVEMSVPNLYKQDQQGIIQYLNYLVKVSKDVQDNHLNKVIKNGYVLYNYTTNDFAKSRVLSSYVFFPKKDIIVYIDFQNVKPPYKSYNSVHDFVMQRDTFLDAYTMSLKKCLEKK